MLANRAWRACPHRCGDIVHISDIQIAYPDVAIAFDLDKDLAINSRKRLLDIAATERIAIAGAHVKGAGFGYVVSRGAGYSFDLLEPA